MDSGQTRVQQHFSIFKKKKNFQKHTAELSPCVHAIRTYLSECFLFLASIRAYLLEYIVEVLGIKHDKILRIFRRNEMNKNEMAEFGMLLLRTMELQTYRKVKQTANFQTVTD